MTYLFRWAVLILASAPFVYYLLATYCTWEYFRTLRKTSLPNPGFAPPVSVLKPVRGEDREAYENFASFCRLDYPEYEVLFAVSDADDPAVPIVNRLQRDFPERTVRLVVGEEKPGSNPKVNNLCRLAQIAKYDLLVISDSDVRVEPNYLRDAVRPLEDPAVGLVTAFFRGTTNGGVAARLEGLVLSAETLPGALVARKLEGALQFAFGWTMATTKRHLAAIGGMENIADYHSDDFELGHRMAAQGFRIEMMRNPVWMVLPRGTMREYLRHEMRWSIGLRNVRPAGYVGLAMTFGLPWAVLAAAVSPGRWMGAAYLAAYLVLRIGQVWTAGVWGVGDPVTQGSLWLVPVRDAVNCLVWTAALFSNKIHWRGIDYRVKRGLLLPLTDAKAHQGKFVQAPQLGLGASPETLGWLWPGKFLGVFTKRFFRA
jgi:ceramide glucosyltransferase